MAFQSPIHVNKTPDASWTRQVDLSHELKKMILDHERSKASFDPAELRQLLSSRRTDIQASFVSENLSTNDVHSGNHHIPDHPLPAPLPELRNVGDQKEARPNHHATESNTLALYACLEIGNMRHPQDTDVPSITEDSELVTETTATIIPGTGEVEIHSPTMTSMKWFDPASLGGDADFAVVVAELRSLDQRFGRHLFLVPLRNVLSRDPLPGIGIGEKRNFPGWENVNLGYLWFHKVRVAHSNMYPYDPRMPVHQQRINLININLRAPIALMVQSRTDVMFEARDLISQTVSKGIEHCIMRGLPGQISGLSELLCYFAENESAMCLDFYNIRTCLLGHLGEAYAMHLTGNTLVDLGVDAMKLSPIASLSVLLDLYETMRGMQISSVNNCVAALQDSLWIRTREDTRDFGLYMAWPLPSDRL
ncbi:hypothetical protein SISSUDRAFT_539645 [Sistotremastrum suecicum HHB10207 ss-3]|uniref:Uncharacterized protein n=1 Tax=Sistotremastrum suecicum HHB10207 ss-3 TaxID=1314776 RepID=A0A166F161_9AGAM|nr:hypothetical protein SISSUDRAFT_539645 [Sistotremastrum suecicum HHB10207 ss-3]